MPPRFSPAAHGPTERWSPRPDALRHDEGDLGAFGFSLRSAGGGAGAPVLAARQTGGAARGWRRRTSHLDQLLELLVDQVLEAVDAHLRTVRRPRPRVRAHAGARRGPAVGRGARWAVLVWECGRR